MYEHCERLGGLDLPSVNKNGVEDDRKIITIENKVDTTQ